MSDSIQEEDREPFALEKIISVMLRFCCSISNLGYSSTHFNWTIKRHRVSNFDIKMSLK